ncbi:hypothetical protein V7L32_004308 [Salmonella enterica]|nr:hypothetical protein [Salmonella enterica subsp. enterica serovar Berta]
MAIIAAAIVMVVALLTGCDAGSQSLEWYKNPRGTEDCRNAIDASLRADSNITHGKPKAWSL